MQGPSHPPVFIIGAARSGTSLLYKLLCLHPEVAYISNWVARRPAMPQLAAFNRVAARSSETQRKVWFGGGSNAYVYGSKRSVSERVFPMPHEGEPVYLRCGIDQYAHDGHHPTPPRISALQRALGAIVKYSGAPKLVSKRIANNRRIPLLDAAFPQAKYVEIVRDGRAVALSLSKVDWWEDSTVWWYGGTPRQWKLDGRDPWEICARNWVEELKEIEQGLAPIADDRVLSLHYESFVDDPRGTLTRIASFIGLRDEPNWWKEIDRLSFPDRKESWREKLDAAAMNTVVSIQEEHLKAEGYSI